MAKIILTNEVRGLGQAGDVVEVKNGYARNYLVPRGLGVQWTRGGESEVASLRAARETRAIATLEEAQALKQTLESAKVRVQMKAGTGGRLFGSVKNAAIADAVAEAGLGQIDKRKITLPAIKTTGEYRAIVHLHEAVDARVTIQVITER